MFRATGLKGRSNIMKKNKMDIKKFANIKKTCAVCGGALDEPVISYPKLPLTETYSKSYDKTFIKGIDQYFHICKTCSHSQISNCINPSFLYGNNYKFRTSESNASKNRIEVFVNFLKTVIGGKSFNTIIDIGCNDTYLLAGMEKLAKKLYGIDPILKEREKHSTDKVVCIGKLLEDTDIKEIAAPSKNLVLSTHTLEHVENPKEFIAKILSETPHETLYVFEFPYFTPLLKRNRFDQIFHQHMQYFSQQSFEYLINSLGCEVVKMGENYHAWGSLLVAFKKSKKRSFKKITAPLNINRYIENILKKYEDFKDSMQKNRTTMLSLDDKIFGYGAALMLPVVFYHLGINADIIDTIYDDDQTKNGLTYANLPVKIMIPEDINSFGKKSILITAFDNVRPILCRLKELEPKNIIVPINVF